MCGTHGLSVCSDWQIFFYFLNLFFFPLLPFIARNRSRALLTSHDCRVPFSEENQAYLDGGGRHGIPLQEASTQTWRSLLGSTSHGIEGEKNRASVRRNRTWSVTTTSCLKKVYNPTRSNHPSVTQLDSTWPDTSQWPVRINHVPSWLTWPRMTLLNRAWPDATRCELNTFTGQSIFRLPSVKPSFSLHWYWTVMRSRLEPTVTTTYTVVIHLRAVLLCAWRSLNVLSVRMLLHV